MRESIEEVWLPQALSIDVGYELFWELNPNRLKPFRKSAKWKSEEKLATMNYNAWLNGIYFGRAISASLNKNAKYPEKPIDLTAKETRTSKDDAEAFGAWVKAFNHSHSELPDTVI